jgi:hypothetical protein
MMSQKQTENSDNVSSQSSDPVQPESDSDLSTDRPREIGGPKGLEPTRYGDWEQNGRCSDF